MRNLEPMRYKDYVWPHNPRHYTITYERRMAAQAVPYGHYVLQDMGLGHRVMRGSGEFVGPEAYEEFRRLARTYYGGGEGTLVHPCWQSAHVYFVKLTLEQVPRPDYVAYSFEFWESYDHYDTALKSAAAGHGKPEQPKRGKTGVYHRVQKGETLWLIARRYHTSVEQLLRRNPQIKNPNLIYVGQKVQVSE